MEGYPPKKLIDGIYFKPQETQNFISKEAKRDNFSYTKLFSTIYFIIIALMIFAGAEIIFFSQNVKAKSNIIKNNIENKIASLRSDGGQKIQTLNELQNDLVELDLTFLNSGQKTFYMQNMKSENPIFESQRIVNIALEVSEISNQIASNYSLNPDYKFVENKKDNSFDAIKTSEKLKIYLSYFNKNFSSSSFILKEFGSSDSSKFQNYLNSLEQISENMPNILGYKLEKTYFLAFQNPAEARPTGGFIGNYGILNVKNGKIEDLKVNDIYAMKYDFRKGKEPNVKAQIPLKYFQKGTHIWESNWNADFPTSARFISDTYQKYGGPKPDGIIALNPKVICDILKITGPVEIPSHKVTLNSDNFFKIVEYKVEVDNDFKRGDSSKNPKQILTDFTPIFLGKIMGLDENKKSEIAKSIISNLNTKHILLYSADEKIQNQLSFYNLSGEFSENSRDYLQITRSNISGTKSSQDVTQKIDLQTIIMENGEIINELEIKHNAKNLEGFLRSNDRSFIEVFVPKGSSLLNVELEGKDVPLSDIIQFDEDSKTCFGYKSFWLVSGEEKTMKFRYKLPFQISADEPFYSISIQKHAGTLANDFSQKVITSANHQILKTSSLEVNYTSQTALFKTNLEFDRYLGILFK